MCVCIYSFIQYSVWRQVQSLLHIVQSRASSFKWEYPLLSLRSTSSFLRLLVTSISPFIFPSITCFRRQFLRKMYPFQLAFPFLISCRIWWYGDMAIWWYGDMVIWRYGDMVIWRYGGMVIWWYGDMAIWWYGDMVIWRYGDMGIWRYGDTI